MEAQKLLKKIQELGFKEFLKKKEVKVGKVEAKQIEWVFAFPKMREALVWLSDNLSWENVLEVEEKEVFEGVEVEIEGQIGDLEDLLYVPMFQKGIELDFREELEKRCKQQQLEIKELEAQLACLKQPNFVKEFNSLQNQLNEVIKKVSVELKEFLIGLNSSSDMLQLETLRVYTENDQKLSEILQVYLEAIQSGIQKLDISPHHLCLVSAKAQEYSELYSQRNRLQQLHITQIKHNALAAVAVAKYESALKCFQDIMVRQSQDKFIKQQQIQREKSRISQEIREIEAQIALVRGKFESVLQQFSHNYISLGSFQEFSSLSNKKTEYQTGKMQEVLQFLTAQKKRHLLALAQILIQQDFVQQKYNKIHQIQSFLDDLQAQANFRLEKYSLLKQKQSLKSKDRIKIDSRDTFLRSISEFDSVQQVVNYVQTSLQEASSNIESTHYLVRTALEKFAKFLNGDQFGFEDSQQSLNHFAPQLNQLIQQFADMVSLASLELQTEVDHEFFAEFLLKWNQVEEKERVQK